MSELSLSVLCIGAALVIANGAYAKGGTYHQSEFIPLTASQKKPSHGALIHIKSTQHRHHYMTPQH